MNQARQNANPAQFTWMGAFGSVLSARIATLGVAFLGAVFMGRLIGPAAYGYFAILVNITYVAVGFAGSAIDSSLVRFAAKHMDKEEERALGYFRGALRLKLWIAVGLIALGIVCARPLAAAVLVDDEGHQAPAYLVTLAFSAGAVLTLTGFAQAYYQAQQRFGRYAGLELLNAVLRWTAIGLLLFVGYRHLGGLFAVYAVAPIVTCGIAWSMLPRTLWHT